MVSVALIGAAVAGLCAYRLPIAELNSKFVVLTLITILIGSRISIKIPGAGGQISVSDTFVFLAILLFGVEAAVLLAAVEALSSSMQASWRFRHLFLLRLCTCYFQLLTCNQNTHQTLSSLCL
jgi:uncharacterized membrane protein